MKTASTLLLATALVGGASCRRVLQDIPEVGLGPTRFRTPSTSLAGESSTTGAEEELVEALEADDQVTVVSEIEVGELLCDSLVNAEDAATLAFVLLEGERVVADQTSYTVKDGEAFTDGIGRKVWKGVVTDPEQGEDEAVPRTISMTWGDVCDTETFLLKVTKRNIDGTTSIVKTVPCFESTTETCLVEVMVEFEETDDPVLPDDDTVQTSSSTTRESPSSSSGSTGTTTASGSSGRRLQLQNDTEIDVMVLYSVSALTTLGGITPQQMETIILESLAGTNQAMVNSEVSVYMNPVHVGLLPYAVTTSDSATTLTDFQANTNVGILRDSVGADLVQLLSDFDNSCGRGYLFDGNEAFGYSLVQATCLDDYTHTHLFGHNLGCNHNREDTIRDHEYAHGLRYCDGEDPYRTIMSFSCGTPRVNFFSNPDVIHLNKPTGTVTENNARAIEDNMVAVSNYRDRVTPPTPPPTTAPPTTLPPTPLPTTAPPTTPPVTTRPPTIDEPLPPTAPPTTTPPTTFPTTTEPTTPAPSTVPPTTGLPAPYTLVGCYGDSSRDRVLSGSFVQGDRTMTTEVCAEFCDDAPYFGTEYGQECFCGVDSDDPTRLGDARCTTPCAGDASQTCGGFNAISVYQYNPRTVYLGCWTDSRRARIMDVVESDSSMTNDRCEDICSSYAFCGTQYGRECWCGDESTDHTIHGESTSCNMICAGDAEMICGGFNAMSVWQYL